VQWSQEHKWQDYILLTITRGLGKQVKPPKKIQLFKHIMGSHIWVSADWSSTYINEEVPLLQHFRQQVSWCGGTAYSRELILLRCNLLFASFSKQRPGFSSTIVHMRFMADKVTRFSPGISIFLSTLFYWFSILIFHASATNTVILLIDSH